MAIPLKNGADLYNFEVLRMRFHNLGADPTSDFGVGQAYFNTSTSEGSGKRVRIYDGSAFRSLAYFDEFTALQTKVNAFLDGGVDADGVLENLAEIQKFLDNYSSATDLSEILDTKLDKAGGTLTDILFFEFANPRIVFKSDANTTLGSFGFYDGVLSAWITAKQNWYPLLHSGNVGEYALKTDGSNAMTGNLSMAENDIQWSRGGASQKLTPFSGADSNKLAYYDGSYWKTIAFTDSNVASAQALVHSNGRVGATLDVSGNLLLQKFVTVNVTDTSDVARDVMALNGGNILLFAQGTAKAGYDTYIYGNTIRLIPSSAGSSNNTAMLINSSGNVLIGTTTDDGSKLHVNGIISTNNRIYAPSIFLGKDDYGIYLAQNTISWHGTSNVWSSSLMTFEKNAIKLHQPTEVTGDLHVTGNIIADGEVSAGGAGEEGDTGTGTGGGDALIYSQEFTPTTTSITITHNLSATKGVIVQVWEKNGNYWDMVLVDVEEVDTNTVTLFFGKTETTVHKVVIMG